MPKRHFLMLAHSYKPEKHDIGGWYVSEKLDGMRCFWDGGVSRGQLKATVPWANTDKDERYKEEQVATGLWSRYGNVIHAPDWWLNKLPRVPLDGELYIPNFRQELMKIVKQLKPDKEAWEQVKFYCFDLPAIEDGGINLPNFKKVISGTDAYLAAYKFDYFPKNRNTLITNTTLLKRFLADNEVAVAHAQVELPYNKQAALNKLDQLLDSVLIKDGEGLIARRPSSVWVPWRTYDCLKIKPHDDAEATVIGYTSGRETDKGSKLLGLMGALIVEFNGKRMELSGFTDQERQFSSAEAASFAASNPGSECPDWITNTNFPRGSQVTFKYRGLTKEGIPQEARYFRKA